MIIEGRVVVCVEKYILCVNRKKTAPRPVRSFVCVCVPLASSHKHTHTHPLTHSAQHTSVFPRKSLQSSSSSSSSSSPSSLPTSLPTQSHCNHQNPPSFLFPHLFIPNFPACMVGSANVDRYLPRRNERLNYILRQPEKRHRFGISALAVASSELFTAGRDGTVRAWPLPDTRPAGFPSYNLSNHSGNLNLSIPNNSTPKATKTFDEHVDWVNDILLIPNHNRLVSASSDTTLKVWNINDPFRSLRTLIEHTDYVKALAHVPNVGVASGSLDGRVLVWDLVMGKVHTECALAPDDIARNGSVYCMAGSLDKNTLVSGSTDKTISVWDVRTGERAVLLRGHTDSVRCLALKSDSNYLLSGATDSVVKLWDLRQERCLRSFDSYGDSSIWALAANKSFDRFVAGCRNGSVWYTDLETNLNTVVVPPAEHELRTSMVLDVALNTCKKAVWVSTTGSTVRLWPLPNRAVAAASADMQDCAVLGREEGKSVRTARPTLSAPEDSASYPLYTIAGLPGIIAYRVMNDRRHVMTCNTEGEYAIWDITKGELHKSLGISHGIDIDEMLKKHDTEVSVPSWFQVEIRLGSLSIRLDKGTVSNAEIYAIDAGLEVKSEDIKVNIGEHVVRALFRPWREEYAKRIPESPDADGNHVDGASQLKGNAVRPLNDLPEYCIPDHIAVVVTDDRSPVPLLRRRVGGFSATEEPLIPPWVIDLVRDGKGQSRDPVKISFTLEPAEESTLPPLGTTSLSAPKVLRVKKVTAYVAKELKQHRTGPEFEIDEEHLEILCNGQALPPGMSLATVRQFRWRSPEELHLHFRLKGKA